MMADPKNMHERWTAENGLDCVIHPCTFSSGRYHLCGYVRVPSGHPLHGKDYGDTLPPTFDATKQKVLEGPVGKRGPIDLMCIAMGGEFRVGYLFNIHGGITWAEDNACGEEAVSGEWWFGFDCGHAGDHPSIQTPDYVRAECESLAKQIMELNG